MTPRLAPRLAPQLTRACAPLRLFGRSIATVASTADQYDANITRLLHLFFGFVNSVQVELGFSPGVNGTALEDGEAAESAESASSPGGLDMLMSYIRSVDVSAIISQMLGTAASIAENLLYISLYLIFMLVGEDVATSKKLRGRHEQVHRQIYVYIKGKCGLGCFVATAHGLLLLSLNLSLWLVFALLTFFLNFIPNIGMFIAVCLPMPLVLLDETYAPWQMAIAFIVPALVGSLSKDVLEPMLIGHSTSLQPVALMLAIVLWGTVWGITGMLLAVPITAVARIHFAHIQHPLTRWLAMLLAG